MDLVQKSDVFGHAVHVAARVEPATAAGHVFCTNAFADALSAVAGAAPRAWPLGKLALAKDFGDAETFAVTWSNDEDPRPALKGFLTAATARAAPSKNENEDDLAEMRAAIARLDPATRLMFWEIARRGRVRALQLRELGEDERLGERLRALEELGLVEVGKDEHFTRYFVPLSGTSTDSTNCWRSTTRVSGND